jgi:hypothetical protein
MNKDELVKLPGIPTWRIHDKEYSSSCDMYGLTLDVVYTSKEDDCRLVGLTERHVTNESARHFGLELSIYAWSDMSPSINLEYHTGNIICMDDIERVELYTRTLRKAAKDMAWLYNDEGHPSNTSEFVMRYCRVLGINRAIRNIDMDKDTRYGVYTGWGSPVKMPGLRSYVDEFIEKHGYKKP